MVRSTHNTCLCVSLALLGFFVSFSQVTAATSAKTLSKVRNAALRYGVIGIDEGQFVSLTNVFIKASHSTMLFELFSFRMLLSFVKTWQTLVKLS